ncbi:MAG: glycerol-3-phosphate acyltransferase [Dehalococcoidales bacterium]|nr:glycerol-3-phosphate acyltransferase [Dehalococcoidales bacterium]
MVVPFILLAIGAYLLGSVPAAYLAVKWARGIDIRTIGTGKVGAANVLSAGVPKWLVIPVAVFDIGKGALAVWIAQLIGLSVAQQATVGICAIGGHNWPIYLGFKSSGRGIFSSLGVITILSWKLGLIILVLSYLFAPIKQVAFGVFISLAILPFLSYFLAGPLGITEKLPVTLGFVALSAMALSKRAFVRRTELSKKIPLRTVLLNRILFDRDIADRRLWISKAPTKKQG